MIALILALPVAAAPASAPAPIPRSPFVQEDEYETRLAEAGEDVAKLWELQAWCKEQGRNSDRRKVLLRIVELDENHEEARKALGHHFYADRWFTTRTELSAFRRNEEREMAEKGLVRYGDEWVPQSDAPFLRMGWVKDPSGGWSSPARAEALAREAKLRSEGHQQQQQGVWIHPDEFDRWRQGLWKCGDEWLDVESANAYHSQITRPWRLLGENGHFVLVTTSPYDAGRWGVWWAEQTWKDLVALFGAEPRGPLPVYMTPSVEQYNQLAAGSPEAGIPPIEGQNGWSSCHYAFFADVYFDGNPPEFRGGGVCWYDHDDPNLAPYGMHAVRHAAALSYMDAIDRSWDTVSRVVEAAASGNPAGAGGDFWGEKKLPLWLRFGAASFAERYFEDPNAENPRWAIEWSMQNLGGQLRPLDALFAFPIDAGNPDGSRVLLNEAGLVVSYIARGGNPAVEAARKALAERLKAGEDPSAEVQALQEALLANEAALRGWAGLEG